MKIKTTAVLAAAVSAFAITAATADTIKMAFIDPLSGPFGPTGEAGLTSFQLAAEHINAAGGVNGDMIEIAAYDNKISPKESLVQLQKALDDGARYILQGNGSAVAAALIDAVNKHNSRNPGDEVLFFNYAAVTPAFTNEMCSFWHFRFDAHVDMKMAAITDYIEANPDIKKIYLIGQDYVFGQAVAAAAVAMLAEKRPDIEIVGNELHPLGKVKDFTPYIQKIISSGADAVITGNWGADMTLLMKAAAESGSDIPYLTFYGGSKGALATLQGAAVGTLYQVSEGTTNLETSQDHYDLINEYKERFPEYDYFFHRNFNTINMFAEAAAKAGSNDPIPVAKALEGLEYQSAYGPAVMRAEDHQVQQPLYISVVEPVSDGLMFNFDNTDYGWKLVENGAISLENAMQPTTCEMERPE
ncbi:MAG: branched-chain amino acid ABC transporter substrate-binding protein [Maritimibacter sp.]|jgi:branched-chain amino acid transport system substrate-binding protein